MQPVPQPDISRPPLYTLLLLCGIIGAALFGIINFSLSAVHPDYIIVKQPIGDLEKMPDGWIQSADFILLGVFICAFAAGLRYELRGGFGEKWIPLTHVFMALGSIMVGVYIHNPPHAIGATVAGVSFITGFVLFAIRFKNDTRWKGWYTYTLITTSIITILCILFTLSLIHNGPRTGLIERGIMIVRGIWLVIFSVRVGGGVRLTVLP